MSNCTNGNQRCMGGIPTNGYKHAKAYGVELKGKTIFHVPDNTMSMIGLEFPNYDDADVSTIRPANASTFCIYDKSVDSFKKLLLTSYKKIKSKDNDELKAAVTMQPVSVGLVGTDLLEYSSGIIDENSCKSNTEINHYALIVGFDHLDGKDYWIVKNSWGTEWGQDGYMYIERQKGESRGTCGIALEAEYPVVDIMPGV